MDKTDAFSLLEVLIAIVIISLLAVFGHTEYLAYVERAKVSEALSVLEEYQAKAMEIRARSGKMAPFYVLFTDEDQTGILTGSANSTSASKQVNLKYVDNVVAYSGTSGSNTYLLLGAQLQHDGVITDGEDFVYVAAVEEPNGVLTWSCGSSASQNNSLDPDYLPKTCQSSLP